MYAFNTVEDTFTGNNLEISVKAATYAFKVYGSEFAYLFITIPFRISIHASNYEEEGRYLMILNDSFKHLPDSRVLRALCRIIILTIALIPSVVPAEVQAPVLKWQYGGCYSSWCETGWYSSPAVADLDNDGVPEVIASAYSIVVLDGSSGALKWRVKSGHDITETGVSNVGRTWPGIVVTDIDSDGKPEIVTAHSGGYVSVYDHTGHFVPGWPRHPVTREFRSLAVSDIDGDGYKEIIAGVARGANYNNIYVFNHDGSVRFGWPQLSGGCCAYGIFNDNIAVSDIDSDGEKEIIVPSDVHYICAFREDGARIDANKMYGDKKWGEVGVWVDLEAELRGWGYCGTEHRPNFAHCPATIADMDGDSVPEVLVVGNVHNCGTSPYTNLYHGPFIFNPDRSRFKSGDFDWETVPVDVGAPICEDYNVIESCMPNPVAADIDGDGIKEILFASNDGKVHCFWLDKSEKYDWPYAVYDSGEGIYRFASEPVVVDLDNDGRAEVIFCSWGEKKTNKSGHIFILDYRGKLLKKVPLPQAYSGDWNGALAAPTIADVDADPDLELVVNTAHSGVVVYDLPGTRRARILWGTGRGNFCRTGTPYIYQYAKCQYDYDRDGDVDGVDLSEFSKSEATNHLELFAGEFGKTGCTINSY